MDSLRAIAALSVVAYHVGFISGMNRYSGAGVFTSHLNIGVPIFFVISGFLLYRPFLAARAGAPAWSVRAYARNRLLRIVPGYWVALTVAAIFPGLVGVYTPDWWWYYGFAQVYSGPRALLGLPVAWTLAVEMSFYVTLPLYALAMRRLGRLRPGLELAVLGALVVASYVVQKGLHVVTIVATLDWFAAGMALAVLSVRLEIRDGAPAWVRLVRRRSWLAWAAALALWIFLCTGLGLSQDPDVVQPYAIAVLYRLISAMIAALVVLPVVVADDGDGVLQRVLRVPALGWLGLVSYGIYLYHLPALVAVWKLGLTDVVPGRTALSYAALGVPAAIALAAASYYVVERPCLKLKRRRAPVPALAPAAAGAEAEAAPALAPA